MSSFPGYFGTVYLFGIIPVARGLYASDAAHARLWDDGLRPWIKWACIIRWEVVTVGLSEDSNGKH